jgi:TetR/AcrR family transcriptional repressor of nem operon
MRYAADHNQATRERIVAAASRLFREHGIAAVGLARIMAEADLTVGTFYTHFKSKEALVQEALHQAMNETLERAFRAGDLELVIRMYLSLGHRDDAGIGCPAAALTSEVARHPRATRQKFAGDLEPRIDILAKLLSARRGKKAGRAEAAALLGLLVGTLQLARAAPERGEATEILEGGIRAALRLADAA